jgi:hypothetical protein
MSFGWKKPKSVTITLNLRFPNARNRLLLALICKRRASFQVQETLKAFHVANIHLDFRIKTCNVTSGLVDPLDCSI